MEILYGILFGLACLAWGYLTGSVPTAVIIARRRGVDITKVGSGNPGGTNVWRTLGWRPGLLCMLLDLAKGFAGAFPVLLIVLFLLKPNPAAGIPFVVFGGSEHLNVYVCLAGLGSALGHSFPLFFRFRGGKNVMVSLGFLMATSPLTGLFGLAVFLVFLFASHRVAVGSLAAAVAIVVFGLVPVVLIALDVYGYQYFGWNFGGTAFFRCDWLYFAALVLVSSFVVVRHHKNIHQLETHASKADF